MEEILMNPDDARKAVEFAAACGALTTLGGGAIRPQPSLKEIEELVATREG
jgi:sugar/nucleoside kinase (ribokinase family)